MLKYGCFQCILFGTNSDKTVFNFSAKIAMFKRLILKILFLISSAKYFVLLKQCRTKLQLDQIKFLLSLTYA
jgi:hypothetical protein